MRCGAGMDRLYHSIAVTQRPKIGHFGPTGAIPKWFGHQWPLLAQSGHLDCAEGCPLLGVKRTSKFKSVTSALDPKRTSSRRSLQPQNDAKHLLVNEFNAFQLKILCHLVLA